MIVQPDFLDHWKTQMLIDILKDPCAPIYVLRLWTHCQNRKTHRFNVGKPEQLKAMCKAPGDAKTFHDALIECGFVRIEGSEWVAHDWDDINASLIAAWGNGKKGGRPKKNEKKNPAETQRKPMGNPDETDKSRLDKIREESNTPLPPKGGDTRLAAKPRTSWTRKQLEAETYPAYPNFQKWWDEYPNGKSKRKSFEAWVKAGLEFEDLESLLTVLDRQKADPEWTKESGAFVPHASTYINQRRFEDDVAKTPAAPKEKAILPKLPPEDLR